jgi:hypothetical protein
MRYSVFVFVLALGALALPAHSAVSLHHGSTGQALGIRVAQQGILWGESAASRGLRGRTGERFSFTCEAKSGSAPVWGTDTYTDDSAICEAALHAGKVSRRGGPVMIQMAPGQSSYHGSSRNGIDSHDYGAWTGSFTFVSVGDAVTSRGHAQTNVRTIEWGHSAFQLGLRGRNGVRFVFNCLAATGTAPVWGTDNYTDDSAICEAGVHAGVLSRNGGTVEIEISPDQGSYKGSSRHGVNSHEYGPWHGSFHFIKDR